MKYTLSRLLLIVFYVSVILSICKVTGFPDFQGAWSIITFERGDIDHPWRFGVAFVTLLCFIIPAIIFAIFCARAIAHFCILLDRIWAITAYKSKSEPSEPEPEPVKLLSRQVRKPNWMK